MCNYCKELMECPVGEKRKGILMEGDFNSRTEMVLDRYKDHTEIFMHSEFTDKEGFWYNTSINITHCPICGEELK